MCIGPICLSSPDSISTMSGTHIIIAMTEHLGMHVHGQDQPRDSRLHVMNILGHDQPIDSHLHVRWLPSLDF